MNTFILFRGPSSTDRFDLMELRDGEPVGVSCSFVDPELARVCDDLEQMNHFNLVDYANKVLRGPG